MGTTTERRRQILDAAASCFARRGFHQATMKDICAAAELSPGGLYRYFRGKEQIIAALVEEDRRRTRQWFDGLARQPGLVRGLRSSVNEVLQSLNDSAFSAMHQEATAEALRNPRAGEVVRDGDRATVAELADLIRSGQKAKDIDRKLDPVATAEVLIALLDGLWWRKALYPDSDPMRHASLVRTLISRLLQPTKKD